ncbi:MAG: hypothetical protein AAF571_12400 [Verrucomicrobiota bacterium]
MKPNDNIHETLSFLEDALVKKEAESQPSWPWTAIYWGLFFLISFAMIDWNRETGIMVFNTGTIIGGLMTMALAIRSEYVRKERGETPTRTDAIVGKVILGIIASFVALVVMGMTGRFDFIPYFQVLMLLIALELYVLGILYKFTPLYSCGLLLLGWSVALAWVSQLQLTIGGCIIAAAMLSVTIAHRQTVADTR